MQEVLVSKIFNYTSTPTKNVEGQFWFNPSTNVLSRFNGTIWKPITVSSDDVAVLTDGSKVSLTNYLNTQISALAEGIDSKQDKLSYYKESNGNATINTNGSIILTSHNDNDQNWEYTKVTVNGRNISIDANNHNIAETTNILTIGVSDSSISSVKVTSLSGELVTTSINSNDTQLPTSKAVKTELDKKQNNLQYYSETSGDILSANSATISVANIKLKGSVAEGTGRASSIYSHAEGNNTKASGEGSHAEGSGTTASGAYSHAEGGRTSASGAYSHAEGNSTITSSNYQHTQGKFNIEDANDKYADIIGNGSANDSRSNAQTVSWDGISWSQTDVRAGGTDQDSATHSLAAKQNATDNSLTTTDKTIVGAINELSSDKQNTLKYYSESDSSTVPSSNNAQVSILGSSDYQTTLNLGSDSSNGVQTINIGGSSNDRRINIGTKICGAYNNVTIGNASDGVSLTLNTGRGLAGTGVTKDLSTSATDAQFPTAAAVNNQLILKQNITDNTLTTTAKTIPGAINELKTATDSMVVVSTDNAINVTPTTAQTGVLIASSKTNGGNVIITPKITNTGACYLSTSSTYSNLNPIYPDPTNNKYTYPNLGTVYLFVDNAGDSADIVIENFAG